MVERHKKGLQSSLIWSSMMLRLKLNVQNLLTAVRAAMWADDVAGLEFAALGTSDEVRGRE